MRKGIKQLIVLQRTLKYSAKTYRRPTLIQTLFKKLSNFQLKLDFWKAVSAEMS
jgi:hypothetical protein